MFNSCFVLFCLPSVHLFIIVYLSFSVYLFVCLPVLSNLHFGIDFGRNDPGPKRPRAESTHLPRPKRPTPKLGRNDPGRNDPGPKRPGFVTRIRSHYLLDVCLHREKVFLKVPIHRGADFDSPKLVYLDTIFRLSSLVFWVGYETKGPSPSCRVAISTSLALRDLFIEVGYAATASTI